MANPRPEVMPDIARFAGARIIGTGRSDFPNQINNALVFPGIFRALLDNKFQKLTTEMKIRASEAIAGVVSDLDYDHIIPKLNDRGVVNAICDKLK